MITKTKTVKTSAQTIGEVTAHIGFALMAVAATMGMLEMPNHREKQVVVPIQPAFAAATENTTDTNPLRREREETGPHYVSYTVAQRTPGRTRSLS